MVGKTVLYGQPMPMNKFNVILPTPETEADWEWEWEWEWVYGKWVTFTEERMDGNRLDGGVETGPVG